MVQKLKALVMGSGFAGQGHAEALRFCDVEVVGMVSRTAETVNAVAKKLNIPYASTDWEQALVDLQPDIVAIGTPGGAHFEPIMSALKHKSHIFSDKPLAETASKAKELYEQAQMQGVKTAYAASYRYQPNVLYAHELIKQGCIGQILEIECISHFNLNPLIPFGWSHRIETGGGRLNNNFTHKLSIVEYLLDGTIASVVGTVRNDMPKAPIVSGVHDFRTRRDFIPNDDQLTQVEWANSNVEWSYSVLMGLDSLFASQSVSALFKHSSLQPRFGEDHIAIYGDEGAIIITGCYGQEKFLLHNSDNGWQEQSLPNNIKEQVPDIDDDTQRNWTALMREFVADIQDEPHTHYQTFKDGWMYQEIIEHIRDNNQSMLVVEGN